MTSSASTRLPGRVTAAPVAPDAARPGITRTTAGQAGSDPGRLLPPGSDSISEATIGLAASAYVGRAKIRIEIPPMYASAHLGVIAKNPAHPNLSGQGLAPAFLLPDHPDPKCNYYEQIYHLDAYAIQVSNPDPLKPQKLVSAGVFPDAKVSLQAFGSIPASAVLRLTQVTRHGKLVPLAVTVYQSGYSLLKTVPQSSESGGGCDNAWDNNRVIRTVVVSGSVQASITDVTIDGHAVPVGSSCRTTTPLVLHLHALGENGTYDYVSGGTLLQVKDRTRSNEPNNHQLAFPDSENLTVPPFTGCVGSGGQDVSRLVTSLASGPGGTVAVRQSQAAFGPLDLRAPHLCGNPPDPTACPLLPANVPPPAPGR